MTSKNEEDCGGAAGLLTIIDDSYDDGKISCPKHGRQTWMTFHSDKWESEKQCHRCYCEVQVEAIKKHQEPEVKVEDLIEEEKAIRRKEAMETIGRFGPIPESNPELTKLLKDAKPATEEDLRAQRRGYAGLCWKVPHRWFSSNEYLKRGDAMISAIVALGDKVTDDEEERLFSRIQILSCAIRNDPKGYAGTDQMAKRRMYIAAHALRRRITPLADEATSDDSNG